MSQDDAVVETSAPTEQPENQIDPASIAPSLEAVLLTSERPVSLARLQEVLALPSKSAINAAITFLNDDYERTGRSFRIEQVAGGYRLMTLPQFARVVSAFQGARARTSLSHAALESLAIIAYKQPVTRAQLEAIRGVSCGEVLRSLVERRLITITGRAEELGRPLLYGTTKQFLEVFGLSSIKDLPSVEELRARFSGPVEE